MSRSTFAIRHTKNVQKSTLPLFLPFYGPCKYIFVESCLNFFVHLIKKEHFLSFFPAGSFCSRSECEKRKAIWNACVAEIKQDPGLKKDFDAQMLAVIDTMGQYTHRLIHAVLFDRLLPSLHIRSTGSKYRLGDHLLAIGSIGREDAFPIFGMRCARRWCDSNSRCRCSLSMDVFAASFCIGNKPNRDCVAFLAYKYGSAGPVSFDIIDVHAPNGNQSERSLFNSKQSGGHRTNGMPGFVRQPDGPQSWPRVREGTARKY